MHTWDINEGDEDNVGPDEDERGIGWVRRAIRGNMIEEYQTDKLPTFTNLILYTIGQWKWQTTGTNLMAMTLLYL